MSTSRDTRQKLSSLSTSLEWCGELFNEVLNGLCVKWRERLALVRRTFGDKYSFLEKVWSGINDYRQNEMDSGSKVGKDYTFHDE